MTNTQQLRELATKYLLDSQMIADLLGVSTSYIYKCRAINVNYEISDENLNKLKKIVKNFK